MRIKNPLLVLGVLAALSATPLAARAETAIGFGLESSSQILQVRSDHRISARQARRAVRRKGFRKIRSVKYQRRDFVYLVIAEDRRGRTYRIVVDAGDGYILDVDRLGRNWRRRRDWDHDNRPRRRKKKKQVPYEADPGGHSRGR